MAISPDTNIRLLKCPLTIDNKNQLTFSNISSQETYFKSLPYLELEESSYQRKDNILRYPAHIDDIIQYNYIMYQNDNYSNKWFYGFIVDMQYKADNLTYITIATDVWQTWQFDLSFKQSFVEREHINTIDDLPGANFLPEGLETGEFKIEASATVNMLKPIYILAYGRNPKTDDLTSQDPSTSQGIIANGIPNGLFYCICNEATIQGLIYSINNKGFGDAIVSIFAVPALALVGFNNWTLETLLDDDPLLWWMVSDFKANPQTLTLTSRPSTIDGYTPKNKKLLTYPYLYLGYNPQNGSEKIFRYENFTSGTPSFKFISELNPNPSIFIIPQNYRGISGDNISDSVSLNGYPTIGWTSDYYNAWLAQNSQIIEIQRRQELYNYETNVNIDKTKNVLGAISNIASATSNANLGSLISSGSEYAINKELIQLQHQNHAEYINMLNAQKEKQSLLPNKNSLGSSATLLGYNYINNDIFTRYSIKRQFAERIDKYFDMYGYLTNKIKIPNLTGRSNWNYVKTIGANILGNIPSLDLQRIKDMFDTGVTLWHNPSYYLDYSQTNT